MTDELSLRGRPAQLDELMTVHEFLEQVRLRPGMWLPGGSLTHLDSMLIGYRAAMLVHGVEGAFDFWSPGDRGPFTAWLWQRNGRESPLSWAMEIEREAEQTGATAVELFFHLYDQYRRERRTPEG